MEWQKNSLRKTLKAKPTSGQAVGFKDIKSFVVSTKVIREPVKAKISPVEPQIRAKQGKKPKKVYTYLKRRKNPEYEGGVVRIEVPRNTPPFESCLLTTKSDRNSGPKTAEIWVKTRPKWYTDLMGWEVDEETGETLPAEIYTANDFTVSNGKKIKALDRFCEKYQPLYRQKKVTLLFLTFTRANYARIEWKDMIDSIKVRMKREGLNLRGFIWTAEISDNLHFHYHICLCIDRVKWSTIPERMKFENLWGQRTEIDFVKKNIRHYMAKYFAKCDARVIGKRSYGKSNKYL